MTADTPPPTPPPAVRPDLDSFEELHRYCLEPCPSRDVLCYALAVERRVAELEAERDEWHSDAVDRARSQAFLRIDLAAAARENERLVGRLALAKEIAMSTLEVFHLNSQHSRINGHVPLSECQATICASNRLAIEALAAEPRKEETEQIRFCRPCNAAYIGLRCAHCGYAAAESREEGQ